MSRTFAYCRASTADQTTENQVQEIAAHGFAVTPQRTISETVSGSVAANERKGFGALLDRLEATDVLIVTKLDRLGRNAMDVRATVARPDAMGVRVHCSTLGGVDLTSPSGKMTMQVIAAVAEFERDLLIERTQAGLTRAVSQGKQLGRPASLSKQRGRGHAETWRGRCGGNACPGVRDQQSVHHANQTGNYPAFTVKGEQLGEQK